MSIIVSLFLLLCLGHLSSLSLIILLFPQPPSPAIPSFNFSFTTFSFLLPIFPCSQLFRLSKYPSSLHRSNLSLFPSLHHSPSSLFFQWPHFFCPCSVLRLVWVLSCPNSITTSVFLHLPLPLLTFFPSGISSLFLRLSLFTPSRLSLFTSSVFTSWSNYFCIFNIVEFSLLVCISFTLVLSK